MPMERTASVEDMVGNLWRLGRTPSQAEFEQFFSNIAQVGSQQNLAAVAAQAQAANTAGSTAPGTENTADGAAAAAAGIPRVASIDFLRKMIMNQSTMPMGVPGAPGTPIPGMMHGMPGVAGVPGANAVFGAFPAPGSGTMPIQVGAYPGVNGFNNGVHGMTGVDGANGVAGTLAATAPAVAVPTTTEAKPTKAAAKKPAAKKAKVEKAPTKETKKGKAAVKEETPDDADGSEDDSDDEGGGKGKTTDEVRRQRRMLSNRESARRSRRRKLEHVSTLEGQIAMHKAENQAIVERLQQTEQRMEAIVRENAALKAELERLQTQLAAGGGGKDMVRSSSLQRLAEAGLARGGGAISPQIGGDDSPRGFVPFRSLQSYENLLSLQAQGR